MVSEHILARGSSTSPKLQQLMREIAYELMVQQADLRPVHVAGKRLIAQGTDGLSRGQYSEGALSGAAKDVQAYNPLGGGLKRPSHALLTWARDNNGPGQYLHHPASWTAANVAGKNTYWHPHPLLAREAIQAFLRHRMLAPTTTTATFLLPRRYTADWGRLLRHFSTVVIPAGAGSHWETGEFESLIVARCNAWTPRSPSQLDTPNAPLSSSGRSGRPTRTSPAGRARRRSTPTERSHASTLGSRSAGSPAARATSTRSATACPPATGRQC